MVLAGLLLSGPRLWAEDDSRDPALRSKIEQRWWERISAIARVTLKKGTHFGTLPLDPPAMERKLDELVRQGFGAIEIFATPEGGRSYGGLDAKNRYRIDPEAGDMNDFRRLVREAHRRGLAVIAFDNLGYSAIDAPHFLKACDDVRNGVESKEAKWFVWTRDANAKPPMEPDGFFLGGGHHDKWVWSERAQHYYWSKWPGVDSAGQKCELPQYGWSREWQEEVKRIVRFWMETGLDGFVIDAVNWYIGYDWKMGRETITDIVRSYGNAFIQPEGAGGFHEDPVAWITEGGWNCVQDYGLGIWWEKDNQPLVKAISTGDAKDLERALRDYHDRVVQAGGVLYFGADSRLSEISERRCQAAFNVAVGTLLCKSLRSSDAGDFDAELAWLLKLKREHPALQQLSMRRQLPTQDGAKYYAFLKTGKDDPERILAVFNFQRAPQTVRVDLSGVSCSTLKNARTGETIPCRKGVDLAVSPLGYEFFELN
jgi:glycosidase